MIRTRTATTFHRHPEPAAAGMTETTVTNMPGTECRDYTEPRIGVDGALRDPSRKPSTFRRRPEPVPAVASMCNANWKVIACPLLFGVVGLASLLRATPPKHAWQAAVVDASSTVMLW